MTTSQPPHPKTANDRGFHNAFSEEFLRRLDLLAEPEGAHEAVFAGPWEVRSVSHQGGQRFAVVRRWDSPPLGDEAFAVFIHRETALLAAAVLPAVGREPFFRLRSEPESGSSSPAGLGEGGARPNHSSELGDGSEAEGGTVAPLRFALLSGGEEAGQVREFDEDFAAALHVAAALVRSPEGLANLLEAAGFLALEQAGRILCRRIR
ncbi:MAG TPA: hypothetical protein VHR45_19745 [Thermoanaerobaculia bacterium]|nr:hypothetical protein [Thermoanaerobaculia bacterium]